MQADKNAKESAKDAPVELNQQTKDTLEEGAKVCQSVEKEAIKLAAKVGKMNLSDRGNEAFLNKMHKSTAKCT